MGSKSNAYDISAQIVETVAQDDPNTYQVYKQINSSWKNVKSYLVMLTEQKFIEKVDEHYYVTNEGLRFLKLYKNLRGSLK